MEGNNQKQHEAELLYGEKNQFGIYQISGTEQSRELLFEGMDYYRKHGLEVSKDNYKLVYLAELDDNTDLEDIFVKFNINRPSDFKGHSLSVSDVVVFHRNGENTAHFVDSVGFSSIDNFLDMNIPRDLANLIDEAFFDYDTYEYWDSIGSTVKERQEHVRMLSEDISKGDVTAYIEQLKEMKLGKTDSEDVNFYQALIDGITAYAKNREVINYSEAELQAFVQSHAELLKSKTSDRKTVVINAFGGPGCGKSTACLQITEELKKAGYVAEYVQEYAKDLVWEENWEMLNGTEEHQFEILQEQLKRMDRLYGKVDFVVTDSPILLNSVYNNELTSDYEHMLSLLYSQYTAFNFVVERNVSEFEAEGRIHNLEESIEKDGQIKTLLDKNNLYYGIYNHSTITKIVKNAITHLSKLYDNQNVAFENDKRPIREDVENTYINFETEKDIDRHETEFGADGNRVIPHLNDELRDWKYDENGIFREEYIFQAQEIGLYENHANLPADARVTEWMGDLSLYRIKTDVTEKALKNAYEKATVYRQEFIGSFINEWEKKHNSKLPEDVKLSILDISNDKNLNYRTIEVMTCEKLEDYDKERLSTSPENAGAPKIKKLQLDMDGTLANLTKEVLDEQGNFHVSTLNKMMKEEDFFYRLTPFEHMIEAVRMLIKTHPEIEVSILSTAMPDEPPSIPKQKSAWLDKYLPEVTKRYFVEPDVSKGEFLNDIENCEYYLIDDYNVNLEAFNDAGGISIKMLNSYNGGGTGRYGGRQGNLWEGPCVSHEDDPIHIVRELEKIMELPERELPQEVEPVENPDMRDEQNVSVEMEQDPDR